jgi:transcriptional regulator GlxA family with amidase domain
MPPDLRDLGRQLPVRVLLINAGPVDALSWAGLVQPLQLAAERLGPRALQLDIRTPQQAIDDGGAPAQIALLVADAGPLLPPFSPESCRSVLARCRSAPFWGAVGAGVLWLANSGALDGVRIALPWALYLDGGARAGRAILTPHLFDIDGRHLTCCGGAASIDFSLTLIELLFGAALQAQIVEALCVERVRGKDERQRVALQARFGVLQPKLSEAVMLMEANLEEPLSTDDIASLVGMSRRQLERLFKQFLDRQPSRYYLELRLGRSRQLLQGTHHSIVQVGLMCGFSSGSHFSTAFGALFGNTPRQERQRKLAG